MSQDEPYVESLAWQCKSPFSSTGAHQWRYDESDGQFHCECCGEARKWPLRWQIQWDDVLRKGGEADVADKKQAERKQAKGGKPMVSGTKPKVTAGMVDGSEAIPKGYRLKAVPHKEFTYKNAKGNVVTVKAHTEHILVPLKEGETAPAPKPKAKPKAKAK